MWFEGLDVLDCGLPVTCDRVCRHWFTRSPVTVSVARLVQPKFGERHATALPRELFVLILASDTAVRLDTALGFLRGA